MNPENLATVIEELFYYSCDRIHSPQALCKKASRTSMLSISDKLYISLLKALKRAYL